MGTYKAAVEFDISLILKFQKEIQLAYCKREDFFQVRTALLLCLYEESGILNHPRGVTALYSHEEQHTILNSVAC